MQKRALPELGWCRLFEKPSLWFDNRASNVHSQPDFKHIFSGESLWIRDVCTEPVRFKLNLLVVPANGVQRAQYKQKDILKPLFLAELKLCSKSKDLERGKMVHEISCRTGLDKDVFVASTLVHMYGKCGSLSTARTIFDGIKSPNVVTWNALLMGYADAGEGDSALEIFSQMKNEGYAPDHRTFVAVSKACINFASKEVVKQIDGTLVKLKSLAIARAIHSQAVQCGCDLETFVASSLVDLYAKCGKMQYARRVFERMQRHDVVSWTTLVSGYADNGEADTAIEMFERMRAEGVAPNLVTFLAVLKACGMVAALEIGKQIHSEICSLGLNSEVMVANSLVGFYGKCGSMSEAQEVFDALPVKSRVTWTALMTGYSRLGDVESVSRLFEEMQAEKHEPDSITFLCILTACSHAGLVEKGKAFFEVMSSKYGIQPSIEHYHCMINIHARANEVEKAVALAETMPYEPNAITWTTILGACRKWKKVDLGTLAFKSLLRLGQQDIATYLLMASIYATAGMWEEHSRILQALRVSSYSPKKPGQSWWTDHIGRVHSFKCGDRSHAQIDEINARLKVIFENMKEDGYVPNVEGVQRSSYMSRDEKEGALCGHSERLAIGCALINTKPGTTIRIIKNLRVCEDCHIATAIISRIEKRTIVCRDERRFHVFKDGKCSCGDFW